MRARIDRGALGALLGLLIALSLPTSAQAARTLISQGALQTFESPKTPIPPGDGEIEAACGLAFSGSILYVSDYYHGQIYTYEKPTKAPFPQELFQYKSATSVGSAPEGPCQLASGPAGALYANVWHQSALRVFPSAKTFDIASPTGLATDSAGNLYVNDRTHVSVYSSTGTLLQEVGAGHLIDAYGLAVSGKEVFVADARTNEVVVFEPSVDPVNPKRTITGTSSKPFTSLKDASLAIDPTNGHLLVLDDLQPGFEHPHGAIDEFDDEGHFIAQLKDQVIDALPSGMAVDPETGMLFVTSGNTERSNAFAWSAEGGGSGGSVGGEADSPFGAKGSSASASGQDPVSTSSPSPNSTATTSEAVQQGNLRVAMDASLVPKKLPREKNAPVHFSVSANVSSADGSIPPQLRGITVKINRNGSIDPTATPVCEMDDVQPSTTQGALSACRDSFVGEGKLIAKVLLTQQSPFPSSGRIVAFNGTYKGRPAILAHVYGTKPVPTSFTMPFVISRISKGAFGTQLHATLPHFSSKWGYITGISLNIGETSHSHGKTRSYISAACRAPKGFGKVSYSLTQTELSFQGHGPVSQTLQRSCGVR
jgi:DNA-binding beta-propeller fold protein YncE